MSKTLGQKPLILVTNDDGIEAPGIAALATEMATIGDVVVAAPAEPHSGMSQAITSNTPIRCRELHENRPYRQYAVAGTPTDCVKLALATLVERRPDLVVSGINHGSNASVNVLYSGTMGAALEGCVAGIPSIGFSLVNSARDADMSPYMPYCNRIASLVLQRGLPDGVALNVNLPRKAITGVRVCRQARAKWVNEFDSRVDPWGHNYYWLIGTFCNLESQATDTDDRGLGDGCITIVPVHIDMTDYPTLEQLKQWPWEE